MIDLAKERRICEERYYKIKNDVAAYPCSNILREVDELAKEQFHQTISLLNEIERLEGNIANALI